MDKESITIQAENNDISSRNNVSRITQVKKDEAIIINRPANHNEISIMENDWSLIRDKVSKIKIYSGVRILEVIIGAMISHAIEIVLSLFKHNTPNWGPFIIYLFLYVIINYFKSKVPFIKSNSDEINKMHLQELNELLDRADSCK